MSDKKLALLGILAVLMAVAAIVQHHMSRHVYTADFSNSALIEGLAIDSVDAIRITSKNGSQTVHLSKENGSFVVRDKDNYPADVSKINNVVNQCLDVRTVEKITSNPANHADLKVTEETARYLISFLDSEAKPIVTLAFSEPDPDTNSANARLLSSDDVYAIQGAPWFKTKAMDYIDTELLSVQRDTISSVAVKNADSNYILSSPQGSDEITLEKMPDGKHSKNTGCQTVFNALSSLRFEDVTKSSNAPQDLSFDDTYICKLYDLTIYKLSIAKKDDKTYVKISADFLDKTPVEKTMGQVESDEELKKKEAKLLAIDVVKEFNPANRDWIYQIPSSKAGDLTKPLSELIEDIPEPETPPAVDAKTLPETADGTGP